MLCPASPMLQELARKLGVKAFSRIEDVGQPETNKKMRQLDQLNQRLRPNPSLNLRARVRLSQGRDQYQVVMTPSFQVQAPLVVRKGQVQIGHNQ